MRYQVCPITSGLYQGELNIEERGVSGLLSGRTHEMRGRDRSSWPAKKNIWACEGD